MTFDLKDVGERGIHMSFDFGERCTVLSFDLGERPQFLFTGPEWKMDDGPGWDAMHFETGPDWVLNLDGGPGWQLYGPPDGWEKTLQCGPVEAGAVVLH